MGDWPPRISVFLHKGTLKLLDAKSKPFLNVFVILLSDYVVITEQSKKQVLRSEASWEIHHQHQSQLHECLSIIPQV